MTPDQQRPSELVPTDPTSARPLGVQAKLEELVATGTKLSENRHAERTRHAYESDFAHFEDWCEATATRLEIDVPSLPAAAETGWLYLSALVEHDNAAEYKVATLERRLSAIKWNTTPTAIPHQPCTPESGN